MNNIEAFLVVEDVGNSTVPSIIANQNRSVLFEAELQEANKPNRNGRIYDRDALVESLNGSIIAEKLKRKTFYGEAGHPLSDDVKRQSTIDQTMISHIVNSISFRGDKVFGVLETANTRCGEDMKGLIRQGSEVSFSMRGLGTSIKKEGTYKRVMSPLTIIAYDWVTIPSHPNSYMTKKLSESLSVLDESDVSTNQSTIITFNMSELAQYITETSQQVKQLMENFEFAGSDGISIEDNNKILALKEGNETLKIFLEKNVTNEINDYLANF